MKYRFNLNLSKGTNRPYFEHLHLFNFNATTEQNAYEIALHHQIEIDKKLQKDNVITDYDILLTGCVETLKGDDWEKINF